MQRSSNYGPPGVPGHTSRNCAAVIACRDRQASARPVKLLAAKSAQCVRENLLIRNAFRNSRIVETANLNDPDFVSREAHSRDVRASKMLSYYIRTSERRRDVNKNFRQTVPFKSEEWRSKE